MIKFIFRWAFRFLILGIVLIAALILLRDQIITSIAETRIRNATGMDVRIGAIHTSLTRPVLSIENLILYNTAEFGGGTFLDVPDLYLEFHPDSAGKRALRFQLVRLNIRELNIVESKEGKTNLVSVTGTLQRGPSGSTNNLVFPFLGIDTLNLSVGKVRSINMRIPSRSQEMDLKLQNEIVQNVRSWDDMAGVVFKILLRAGFAIYFDPPKTNVPRVK